jgi:predicted aconitase with swiveling domain
LDISSVLLTLIVSGITFCAVLTDENVTMLMLSTIIFTFLSLILIRDRRLKQFEILELNYSLRVAQDDAAYQLLQRIYLRAIILSRRDLLYS